MVLPSLIDSARYVEFLPISVGSKHSITSLCCAHLYATGYGSYAHGHATDFRYSVITRWGIEDQLLFTNAGRLAGESLSS